ncbi:hypothetical protein LCGC14_0844050 [marine sediment metagenome]|uniref:Uncharacterized protein n=1 Tax=marine sediment metagenome TaxID=412755 RepID=A0A0F9PC99_9ZZZZ
MRLEVQGKMGNKCPDCGKVLRLVKGCGEICDYCGFAIGVDVE